ncbi:hypothetical protein AB3M75_07200 [Serratia ureilytica]|uniref:hypothetical protein n=1 Tax=Serratia ureilytica TaxID=300181 RepID=UPI00371DA5C8
MMSEKILTLRVTETAIQFYQAEQSVKAISALYKSKLTKYFRQHGRPEGRMEADNPDFAEVIAHTADLYAMLADEKRNRYNAKRRHQNAVRALMRFNQSH